MNPAELQKLAKELLPFILAELGALGTTSRAPAEYTSHHEGPRPAGVALRVWQKQIQAIPGAKQRGRYWVVSREAFERWEASQAAPSAAPSPAPETWTPGEQARRAGGVRVTR